LPLLPKVLAGFDTVAHTFPYNVTDLNQPAASKDCHKEADWMTLSPLQFWKEKPSMLSEMSFKQHQVHIW
jgi:hypothetical protein